MTDRDRLLLDRGYHTAREFAQALERAYREGCRAIAWANRGDSNNITADDRKDFLNILPPDLAVELCDALPKSVGPWHPIDPEGDLDVWARANASGESVAKVTCSKEAPGAQAFVRGRRVLPPERCWAWVTPQDAMWAADRELAAEGYVLGENA